MTAIGIVVHPRRDISRAVEFLAAWAAETGTRIGQLELGPTAPDRVVARPIELAECDLVLAIGGDGTMLSAIRAASGAELPVLGVACGSLGVLSRTTERELPTALDRFFSGDYVDRRMPALQLVSGETTFRAFNDFTIVRRGDGQIRITATVDGETYIRTAGDGVIVSTPLGSSAYSLSSGGPLLPLELQGFLLTPLPAHGGSHPPLVLSHSQTLDLRIDGGYGGARLEVDGRAWEVPPEGGVRITLLPESFRAVFFSDGETFLAGLRARGIISDSPRVLVEEARSQLG